MTNSRNKIAEWVIKSIWLDLAYDEEDRKLAKEEAQLDLQTLPEPQKVSLPERGKPESWFKVFLKLKGIRIRDGLDFDEARLRYANSATEKKYPLSGTSQTSRLPQKEFSKLDSRAKRRNRNLDAITWRCGGAIGHLVQKHRKARAKKKDWATLLALFHSELCASATPDISFGVASRFSKVVQKETVLHDLFRVVARHNVARGLNHLNNPLDATRTLDRLVDDFIDEPHKEPERGNFGRIDLSELPETLKDKVEERRLLLRIFYFPAIRTLAQAYDDLNRHAEQNFYLETGSRVVQAEQAKMSHLAAVSGDADDEQEELHYWRTLFDIDTHLLDPILGCEDSRITEPGEPESPRAKERKIRINVRRVSGKAPEIRPKDIWWKLCWHADQGNHGNEFRLRLETTARTLREYLADRETRGTTEDRGENGKQEERKSFEMDQAVANFLLDIEKDQHLCKNDYWRWLLDDMDEEPPPEWMRRDLWTLGAELLKLIEHTIDNDTLRKNRSTSEPVVKELEQWKTNISRVLQKEDVFRQFRSEAEAMKLLQECNDVELNCCPGFASAESGYPRLCEFEDTSCAYETLHLDENKTGEVGDRSRTDTRLFASLNYYFSTMSAQQARFLEYLRFRTGRMRRFRQGEPCRPAARFQLISLRRWNSFSPNLGSRAAASVGGGYLVRIWSEELERYVGIGVDPGYNYLENLFNEGFTIPDIDILLITHAHPDHTENLTNFFTLLRERQKRMEKKGDSPVVDPVVEPEEHKIILAMTEGVFERYASHLRAEEDSIREIVVLKAKDGKGSEASAKTLVIEGDSLKDSPCHVRLIASDEDKERSPNTDCSPNRVAVATLQAKHAWHYDGTEHDSMGVVITRLLQGSDENGNDTQDVRTDSGKCLGIISDSRYHPELENDYGDCSLIVAHLGGLLPESRYLNFHQEKEAQVVHTRLTHLHSPQEAECTENEHIKCSQERLGSILKDENHLYLPGLCRLICDLSMPEGCNQAPQREDEEEGREGNGGFPIVVLSEFGEELRGGLRTDLTRRLSACLKRQRDLLKGDEQDRINILPCDVGLRIDIEHRTIFCSVCHRYVLPEKIRPESVLPGEEALAYVCDDCRTLRKGELPELLLEWCQTGRPVVPLKRRKADAGSMNLAGEETPSG